MWYTKSREAIQSRYGEHWLLYCACLAATSPMSELKGNITLADKAFYRIIQGQYDFTDFIHSHKVNLERVASGRPLQGQKITAFYANLIGDDTKPTIDRWIMRYLGYANDIPSKKQYAEASKRIEEEAKQAGYSVADYQARIWCQIRGKATSFANYLEGKQLQLAL